MNTAVVTAALSFDVAELLHRHGLVPADVDPHCAVGWAGRELAELLAAVATAPTTTATEGGPR